MLASIVQRLIMSNALYSDSSLAVMIVGILFILCLVVGLSCGIYSLATWRKGDRKRIVFGGVAGILFSGGQLVLIIVVAIAASLAVIG